MHEYSNQEITVKWNARKCIHSGECSASLHSVFNPSNKPWINIEGSDIQSIKLTIDKCPSGALSYETKSAPVINESVNTEIKLFELLN